MKELTSLVHNKKSFNQHKPELIELPDIWKRIKRLAKPLEWNKPAPITSIPNHNNKLGRSKTNMAKKIETRPDGKVKLPYVEAEKNQKKKV